MSGGTLIQKPNLPDVTLVCIDCTDKVHLGERAIIKSSEECEFVAVKLLTDRTTPKLGRFEITIPKITTLEEYSRFVIRDLHRYVDTSHCLLIQSDGYVVNGQAWRPEFLQCDYIGAPWEHQGGLVGNGGFSLRSRRFLQACSQMAPGANEHPEDCFVSMAYRSGFEALGMKYASTALARKFAFEGRAYDGVEWSGTPNNYAGSFGFHSWLSRLPEDIDRPLVFHSSGDLGDVIYSLATVRQLGGGFYFLSNDCKHPYPKKPKCCALPTEEFHAIVGPLVHRQPYIWGCRPTHATPYSADANFDEFRLAYKRGGLENWKSLLDLHAQPFGVKFPAGEEVEPWLECDDPVVIEGRPIVVNRTSRYLNMEFPWWQLTRKYGHQMVFIGSDLEYSSFCGLAPDIKIERALTPNLWEAARVIKGGKVFIGNQSAPMAIALGLGVPLIQEVWPQNPNCKLLGPNRIFWERGGEIEIPKEWLK